MKNLMINSFKGLSAKQRSFMWTYLDNDQKLVATCKQAKMNTDTFYRWCDKPLFKSYYDFMLALHTDAFEVIVWKKLMEKIERGDVKAIRTYFEVKNKLKSHETKVTQNTNNIRVKFGKKEENSRIPNA